MKNKSNDMDLGNDSGGTKLTHKGQCPAAILRKSFRSGGPIGNPHKEKRGEFAEVGSARESEKVQREARINASKGKKPGKVAFVPDGINKNFR